MATSSAATVVNPASRASNCQIASAFAVGVAVSSAAFGIATYFVDVRRRKVESGRKEDCLPAKSGAHGKPAKVVEARSEPAAVAKAVVAKKTPQQPKVDKAANRLEWWQRLNQVKPILTLPEPRNVGLPLTCGATDIATHLAVTNLAADRMHRGKDWLVRDSDYAVAEGEVPAHAGVKCKVNAALIEAVKDVFGDDLCALLSTDPRHILLLLDTPRYGTLQEFVSVYPSLRWNQQTILPQADLAHYFEMVRSSEFYPGVRAQRLDHWLCGNSTVGFKCLAAFLDYECRLSGSLNARLCPAADIMRFFRFGYPAEPACVLAITVGLEEPATTPEEVDGFVRCEAQLNGYVAELREVWKYRMVSLLYVIRPADS